ncbi:MAG TPA: acyltransferase [Verrucomicrobiae bacterium]|jgi:peptidoglycan/LPS O-acetylase OafA/YrhL|nr:acyltransferase [Verrucomicrobiae bacterium]
MNGISKNHPAFPSRLPSLDGWRAVSILMVLGAHMGALCAGKVSVVFRWIFDGNLGVRCFFVISGFLITWLMVQEGERNGHVSLRSFYIRRGLRILPVYFAFVLVLFALQLWTHFSETAPGWIGTLTFTRNFVNGSMASTHLWSLSIEEQFYLIWPGLFVLLCRHRLRPAVLILAVPILMAPLFRIGTYFVYGSHKHFLHGLNHISLPGYLAGLFGGESFFLYADSLAFGCLFATILFYKSDSVGIIMKERRLMFCIAAGMMVVFPHFYELFSQPPFSTPPLINDLGRMFSNSVQAIGVSLFLLQGIQNPNWGIYRLLNSRPIVWVGVLSYSLYIWQEIFWIRAWNGGNLSAMTPIWWTRCWLLPVMVTAVISFYGLERPLFQLRSRFRQTDVSAPERTRQIVPVISVTETPSLPPN